MSTFSPEIMFEYMNLIAYHLLIRASLGISG
jgi:hypothetical protein